MDPCAFILWPQGSVVSDADANICQWACRCVWTLQYPDKSSRVNPPNYPLDCMNSAMGVGLLDNRERGRSSVRFSASSTVPGQPRISREG